MYLKRLSLLNFKNVAQEELSLVPGINCFVGDNGAGKTNIMEAVYYLSMCKSSLGMTDGQSIRHGADFLMLDGRYVNDAGEDESVSCGMKRGQKKHFKRNKKEYKRLSAHIGLVPLILVSPSDTALIEGGPTRRCSRFTTVSSPNTGG